MTKYVAIALRDGRIDDDLMKVFNDEDDANKYIIKCFVDDLIYWHAGNIHDVMEFVKNHDNFNYNLNYEVAPGYICCKCYDVYIEYMVYQVAEV